jgi:hypothetical protein
MAAAQITIGKPERLSGEFIGLMAAVERYGVPYSSLRAWVKSGLIPSWTTPNRRVFVRPQDIEQKLFRPVEPKPQPHQED